MTRHETTAQRFRRYATLKLRNKKIQVSRNGLLLDIGIMESCPASDYVMDRENVVFEKSFYIRYGNDTDFSCWVEGAWMGQAVRRFIRAVKAVR